MEVAVVEHYLHSFVCRFDFVQNGSISRPFDAEHHFLIEALKISSEDDVKVDRPPKFVEVVAAKGLNHIAGGSSHIIYIEQLIDLASPSVNDPKSVLKTALQLHHDPALQIQAVRFLQLLLQHQLQTAVGRRLHLW